MSSAQAILMGAIVIAAAILFVDTIHPAEAQRGGPFQLELDGNTTAKPGVFRLDTLSGEVSYCFISDDGTQVMCSKSSK
jgi:hypothetical protein